MLGFSPIAYERIRNEVLTHEGQTGTLVTFTIIHATRQGYPGPLHIGLITLDETKRMLHCQLVGNLQALECGAKIRLGAHLMDNNPDKLVLKAELV